MIITTHLFDRNTSEEHEVELVIRTTEERKGNGPMSYYGPTPDEPAEAIVEYIHYDGEQLLDDHPFYDLLDGLDIDELVEERLNYLREV